VKEAVADADVETHKTKPPKRVLALPDLEHAKTAVLNSLTSASGQRTYDHAIREFVAGTVPSRGLRSTEPSFSDIVFTSNNADMRRPRSSFGWPPSGRIAYEAADAGLLSPELAAGIRRVNGVRRMGVRLGNWLTPEQGRRLLECATRSTARELRDHAMVAMLIGCGLRRAELLALHLEAIVLASQFPRLGQRTLLR
jgi:integrase